MKIHTWVVHRNSIPSGWLISHLRGGYLRDMVSNLEWNEHEISSRWSIRRESFNRWGEGDAKENLNHDEKKRCPNKWMHQWYRLAATCHGQLTLSAWSTMEWSVMRDIFLFSFGILQVVKSFWPNWKSRYERIAYFSFFPTSSSRNPTNKKSKKRSHHGSTSPCTSGMYKSGWYQESCF